MLLTEYLVERGHRFFRLRSYLPLLLVPVCYLERDHFRGSFGAEEESGWCTGDLSRTAFRGLAVSLPRRGRGRSGARAGKGEGT